MSRSQAPVRDGSSLRVLYTAMKYVAAFESGTDRQRQRWHVELLKQVREYRKCTVPRSKP